MERLTSAEFYAKNTALAEAYKAARAPEERQRLLSELYTLDIKVFRAWRLKPDERPEFRNEAFLFLAKALETHDASKGPFLHWLRYHVLKTFESYYKQNKPSPGGGGDGDEVAAPEEEARDPVFWRRAKELCTEGEWAIVEMRFQEGLGIEEIAARLGVNNPKKIGRSLADALEKIKVGSFQAKSIPTVSDKNLSTLDPHQAAWISKAELASRLTISHQQLRLMLSARVKAHSSPCMIDPRDVVRLPRVRIRFLETDAGLIYPRIIRRGGSTLRR